MHWQVAQQLFRQGDFDRECQAALHTSRRIMGRVPSHGDMRLSSTEAQQLAGMTAWCISWHAGLHIRCFSEFLEPIRAVSSTTSLA